MEETFVLSEEVCAKVRDLESNKGKKWLEKELTRLLHSWQGTSRTCFTEKKRPPWWVPGRKMDFEDTVVEIPSFQSRRKGNWTHENMRSLIACAYETTDVSEAPTSFDQDGDEAHSEMTSMRDGSPDISAIPKRGGRLASRVTDHVKDLESTMKSPERPSNCLLNDSLLGDEAKENDRLDTVESPVSDIPEQGVSDVPEQVVSDIPEQCKEDSTPELSSDLDELMAEMDLEVQARCESLRNMAEQIGLSMQNAFRVEVMKLPKKIRTMSIQQFHDKYAGDVDSVIIQDIKKTVEKSIAMDNRRTSGKTKCLKAKLFKVEDSSRPLLSLPFAPGTDSDNMNQGQKRRRAKLESAAAEGLATGRIRRTRARTREALKEAQNLGNLTTPSAAPSAPPGSTFKVRPMSAMDPDMFKTPQPGRRGDLDLSNIPKSAIKSIRRGNTGKTRLELDDGQEIELSKTLRADLKSVAKTKLLALQQELQSLMTELDP